MTILYEQAEEQAQRLVPLLGGDATVVDTPEVLARRVTSDPSEILVVFGPGTALPEVITFADHHREARPRLGVVLLREGLDDGVVAQATQAGVRAVVDAADPAAILAACARAQDESRQMGVEPAQPNGHRPAVEFAVPVALPSADAPPPAGEPEGEVIAVFSAKGGCGTTMLATNLAVVLAAGGTRRVCLIDLDLAAGDVAIMTQLTPDRTIADAIAVADRIDELGLRALLVPYQPGVDALLAPVQPSLAEQVTGDLVAEILQLARGMFDAVVVDCAGRFGEQTLAALDAAQHYVLVTTPELPALKNLRVTLDMFDLLEYRRDNRLVVLNRAGSKGGLSTQEAERVVRAPISGFLPSSRDVPAAVNRGVPLVIDKPNHAVSAAIRALAAKHLADTGPVAAAAGLRGLMSRRSGAGAKEKR
jgi:pilus assembly protein CpaE